MSSRLPKPPPLAPIARALGAAGESDQARAARALVGGIFGAAMGAFAPSAAGELFPAIAQAGKGLDDNQRYTTRETLNWCLKQLQLEAFDLDVAACEEAHHAPRWYSREQNGLAQPWDAGAIWCNPPFDNIEPWVDRAWKAMLFEPRRPIIAMLLPENRREQRWWQQLVEPWRDGRWCRPVSRAPGPFELHVLHDAGGRLYTHTLPGRVRFGFPGNPEAQGETGSPPFGCVLLEWCWEAA